MAGGRQRREMPEDGRRQAEDRKACKWQEADRGQKSLQMAGGRQRTEKPANGRMLAEDKKV